MITDPDLLARLHQFPLIRDGRVKLQNRSGGYSLFDAILDQPIVRIRPADDDDKVVLLYPDPRGRWMPTGALGDQPLEIEQALLAVERAVAFLDQMADAMAHHGKAVRRRRPL